MPNMSDLLQESRPFMKVGKMSVFDTNHAIEQHMDRYDKPVATLRQFFGLVVKAIRSKPKIFESDATAYLVYSKTMNISVVLDYRRDMYSNEKRRHLFVITYLPPGKQKIRDKNAKKGTKKVEIESWLDNYLQDVLLEMLSDKSALIQESIDEECFVLDEFLDEFLDGVVFVINEGIPYDVNLSVVDLDDQLGQSH